MEEPPNLLPFFSQETIVKLSRGSLSLRGQSPSLAQRGLRGQLSFVHSNFASGVYQAGGLLSIRLELYEILHLGAPLSKPSSASEQLFLTMRLFKGNEEEEATIGRNWLPLRACKGR